MEQSGKSSGMRFTRLEIENWRNFSHAGVDLQRRAFLIGPNASGKSNFLDVFRFLSELVAVGGGLQAAVLKRGGVSPIRSLYARQNSDVKIVAGIGTTEAPRQWEYEISFNGNDTQGPQIRTETVRRNGEVILERPNEEDKSDKARLTQSFLEQVNMNREFRQVAEFFSSVSYLHLVPQLIRDPDRTVGRPNDPFGGDFLQHVFTTTEKRRSQRLNHIQKALSIAVPQMKTLDVQQDEHGRPHLRCLYEHWRPNAGWQTEAQFSDGTLRLIGLLWSLQEGNGPLLLEEPELSLHPALVRYLPQMFAQIQQRTKRQILMSTHSPEMLSDKGIALDEILLFESSEDGTQVEPALNDDDARALVEAGLSAGEAVQSKTQLANIEQFAFALGDET